MKSAKDFAKAWGINSASAGKKLKRLNAVPESQVGAVLFYTDETFTKLTGVKVKKTDFSNLISSVEIAAKFNIKDKSVKNNLRKHNVKVELIDGGISYYSKEKALSCFSVKQKKLNTSSKTTNKPKKIYKNPSKRYRLSILSRSGDKFIVRYMGLKRETCLSRMEALLDEGWDFCVKGYDVGVEFDQF